MADLPEPDTHESSDTPTPPPDITDTPGAARHTRALQIVAGILIVAAVVLLLRGLLTPVSPTGATPGHATSSPAPTATAAPADPLVGHYAPNVTLRDLRDTPTPLSSLRGKVVLLNFWYASCLPCQIEMPALERIYLAHQSQGFEVVGVDVVDDAATISEFTSRLGITYPMLRDIGERAILAYQVRATPSSFLIDRAGVIRAVYAGPVNTSTFQQQLTTLLAPAG